MVRRSLKEAVQGSGLVEEPELKAFVFGHEALDKPVSANGLQSLPRTSIHLTFSFTSDRKPVRHYYDQEELKQWAEVDIKVNGIQSPLWVRPLPGGNDSEYELVAGLRRYLAAEILGLENVPAIICRWSDEQAFQASLSENINRRDFTCLEHLDGTLKLLASKLDTTVETVIKLLYRMNNEAKRTNQNVLVNPEYEVVKAEFEFLGQISWQSFVSTRLPLINKPEEILGAIRQGKIQYTKGLEISKIKDAHKRQELLQLAISEKLSLNEIKEHIKILVPKTELTVTPKDRFTDTYKRIKAAKVWDNPKKVKRLEKLMAQLEDLLQDE